MSLYTSLNKYHHDLRYCRMRIKRVGNVWMKWQRHYSFLYDWRLQASGLMQSYSDGLAFISEVLSDIDVLKEDTSITLYSLMFLAVISQHAMVIFSLPSAVFFSWIIVGHTWYLFVLRLFVACLISLSLSLFILETQLGTTPLIRSHV